MTQETYDNINRYLKEICEDIDMKPEVFTRLYQPLINVGSGEDFALNYNEVCYA